MYTYTTLLYAGGTKKMKEILLDKRLQSMVSEYVPQGEVLDELVCFFSIFSDYTRLKMISALAISEMCVSDLSTLLKLNQTTVSHQLRLLKNLNAVKTKRQGKVVFYSLRSDALSDVLLKGVEFLGY
jgi:ArsR family transcriptional regulator